MTSPGDRAPHRRWDISAAGVAFIGRWEGFRSHLYNDPAGHCTIGYGHLVHRGRCNGSEPPGFRNGITEAEGRKLLKADCAIAVGHVNDLVKVRLNQTQFDAIASFTYNAGGGSLRRSTLLGLLNQGDYNSVPEQLMHWTNKGLPGLVRRRRSEGQLFTKGRYDG